MNAALQICQLVKRFGGLVATDSISFDLLEGESLGLIGPNGAGKTTIFSLIMGELKPSAGQIVFRGQEISSLSTPSRIALGISRTYQIPRPFSGLSVRENIRIGLMRDSLRDMIFGRTDESRETEIGQMVGFSVTDMKRPAAQLPMGDLRKLEVARTIATGATVLLLDEVFAGLTKSEISMLAELIQSLRKQGFALLMVSHDLSAMEPLVDRAIAIERGSLLAQGSFQEVLADSAVRESYLGASSASG